MKVRYPELYCAVTAETEQNDFAHKKYIGPPLNMVIELNGDEEKTISKCYPTETVSIHNIT